MVQEQSDHCRAEFVVEAADAGRRLDVFLARRLTESSRARVRRAIDAGLATVDGCDEKPAYRLRVEQRVCVSQLEEPPQGPCPEDIPLDVLYEDAHLSVIDKPAGMVVHPAKGHWSGTLASGLAFRYGKLATAGGAERPGIVHRLDRDTSGVIVIARTDAAHSHLARQFAERTVDKQYDAVVVGLPDRDRDVIVRPIGMHPHHRERMAIRDGHGTSRYAETFYEVRERFRGLARLRVHPKTGRTHQIRVHLASIGHPILCDRLYGGRCRVTLGELTGHQADERVVLDRQSLHARFLKLVHPVTGATMRFEAPLPQDLQHLLRVLREVATVGR